MTPQQLKESIISYGISGRFFNKAEWVDEGPKSIFKSLWEVTIWDKKFVGVERYKQKQVKQYKYVLAGEFRNLEDKGDIFLLSTGLYEGYTSEKKAKGLISEGEVVTMPWGGGPTIKYYKGRFVTADNRIATSADINVLSNKFLYYFMLSKVTYLKSVYRGTSLKHPKMAMVLEMRIPIPSLKEQNRIVTKIEELLPLIDKYEIPWAKLKEFNKAFPIKMKKSILQFAIKGKLVDQKQAEGTGEECLKQMNIEKEKLIKAGCIKKEKPFAPIGKDEIPFEIPKNWCWCRFGELGAYKKGPFGSSLTKDMFVPKGQNTIKVYEQKNAIYKNHLLGDYYITKKYFESNMRSFEVFPGDIIVSCAGTIGETYVMPGNMEKGIINQALMRMKIFKPMFIPYFLVLFETILKKSAISSSKGSAIKNIPPFDVLKNCLVPVPPLKEQERIVAKIEELLPLCKQLIKE